MSGLIRLGRMMLGVGMIALGGTGIAFADFMLEWSQVPAHLPARTTFAYIHGIVFIACGVAAHGKTGLQAELLGMASGLMILAALTGPTINRTLAIIFRYAFALCMPIYGLVHFWYAPVVATWIPKWLFVPMFWAYFTGVAHCAAGVAILTGVLGRMAARLFAIMVSSWIVILHIPRVIAALHDRHEWTTLFIAVAITGAAWVLAGSYDAVSKKL
jgi:uncharacterized membrane protein